MLTSIREAALRLNKNEVIGIYTDTIIGICCLEENQELLYKIKKRDLNKKFIRFIYDIKFIPNLTDSDKKKISKFWPGNNTIIIDNIGYRIPGHKKTIELLKEIDKPLVVTSANISGFSVVENETEFKEKFNKLKLLIDYKDQKYTNQASNILIYDKINQEFKKIR